MWKLDSSDGHLYNPTGVLVANCYTGGDAGHDPEGINNPAMQSVHDVGPIPRGPKADGTPNCYTMLDPVNHPKLGPYAIPLLPDEDNEMFGRSGFFCHGDNFAMNRSASDGCIIAPHQIRMDMWESGDHRIEVV